MYEWWADPSLPEDDPGRWLLSCTVLTTTAQDALGHVHDRSPVIIPRSRYAEWLDPDLTDKADIQCSIPCPSRPWSHGSLAPGSTACATTGLNWSSRTLIDGPMWRAEWCTRPPDLCPVMHSERSEH
ncbi:MULTISPECIES: SOS response-associated peptidase family protein [Pseudarthrobacter]|uniref:SOS response-associated peptidase family protein n=1 Tax=Pseudarthrobacter TaxID=1742993 RepID=UPI0028FC30EE|nr:SOS response-associated peptidase family protein [Pseudarthrobacter equi]